MVLANFPNWSTNHHNDLSVFINTDKSPVVGLFVDDMIIAAKTLNAVEEFKKCFGSIHKIKDFGEIYRYLGLTVDMTCKTTLVYYLLYITTVCPTPHFSPLVNNNSSILDLINRL